MKKTLIYTILLTLSITAYPQDGSNFKNKRDSNFKSSSFDNKRGGGISRPPDPHNGGGGNPIPISTGSLLLGFGLASFITHNKQKKHI